MRFKREYMSSDKIVRLLYYAIFRYPYFVVRNLFLYLLRGFSTLVPKRKNCWLFGSRGGYGYSDNAKFLFLYVLKECKDIDAIWISKSKKIIYDLRRQQLPAYYAYSLKGILSCLRGKVIFTTHGKYDVNGALTGGSIHIELYHFVFTLKKFRYDWFKHRSLVKNVLMVLESPFVYFAPDFGVSSSAFVSNAVESMLSLRKDHVLLTGSPRSDAMFRTSKEDRTNVKKVLGEGRHTNLIYFLPSWRETSVDFDYFGYGLDKDRLIGFLDETDSILVFRFHPTDTLRGRDLRSFNKRMVFENHGLSDPLSLLKEASVLITDYSAIYVDYLLLNRPMIFANFDHEKYMAGRKTWDYYELTPGPKAENWELVLWHLKRILIEKVDEYQEVREELRDKLYDFKDGNACARLSKEVHRILGL